MLKCGACLEYGRERTSTRASILCPSNSPTNFFAVWLECPIVKTDLPPETSPAARLSPSASRCSSILSPPSLRVPVRAEQATRSPSLHPLGHVEGHTKDNLAPLLDPDLFWNRYRKVAANPFPGIADKMFEQPRCTDPDRSLSRGRFIHSTVPLRNVRFPGARQNSNP